jgi:serine/threonine protein kinase
MIKPSNPSGATECYIISQPLINRNLAQLLILNSESLSGSARHHLLEQMLEGLAYLHAQGCMHRDLKPENILASASPLRAVIIDFGCATWEKTSRDHLKGTIRYLAPEVMALKDSENTPSLQRTLPSYDLSADIWSMGLTAWELMHGLRVGFKKISRKFHEEELISRLRTADDWASSLIREMLQWHSRARLSAEEAYRRCPGYNTRQNEQLLRSKKRPRETN